MTGQRSNRLLGLKVGAELKQKNPARAVKVSMLTDTRNAVNVTCVQCHVVCYVGTNIEVGGENDRREPTVKPGSITICAECGTFMIFDEALQVRRLTAEDLAGLPVGLLEVIAEIQLVWLQDHMPGILGEA